MENEVKLTKLAKCAGCGAKVGAGTLAQLLERLEVRRAEFLLDRQVSNSGRLRTLLLERAEGRNTEVRVELDPQVDRRLYGLPGVVTADAVILDRCERWYNLNRRIIRESVPEAWVVRLF